MLSVKCWGRSCEEFGFMFVGIVFVWEKWGSWSWSHKEIKLRIKFAWMGPRFLGAGMAMVKWEVLVFSSKIQSFPQEKRNYLVMGKWGVFNFGSLFVRLRHTQLYFHTFFSLSLSPSLSNPFREHSPGEKKGRESNSKEEEEEEGESEKGRRKQREQIQYTPAHYHT